MSSGPSASCSDVNKDKDVVDDELAEVMSQCSIELDPADVEIAKLKEECANKPYLDGHFYEVEFSESTMSRVTAVCKLCPSRKVIRGPLESSSNFLKHLKRVHADVYPEEYNNYKAAVKRQKLNDGECSRKRRRGSCTFSQEKFEKGVAKLILESRSPFSLVELSSFRELFDDLDLRTANNTPLNHISRRTLVRRIDMLFTEKMDIIQAALKKAQYVCTTADIWSSSTRGFLGVTTHWIDPLMFARRSAAIACRRFIGTHSHDRIAELLQMINSSYGLGANKIVATVTDNASNFVKAFNDFGIQTSMASISEFGSDSEESNSEMEDNSDRALYAVCSDEADTQLPNHLRCATHTLHLIATTDVMKSVKQARILSAQHDNTIARCNNLWKMLRSPKQREIMTESLGQALKRPVVVRWNSLFSSLEQIAMLRDKIGQLNSVIGNKNPLRDTDYEYISEYLTCLRPVAETVDKLQGEKYCFYGYLSISLVSLRRRLCKILEDNDFRYCKPILDGIIKSVNTRFSDFFNIEGNGRDAAIAATLLPQFKRKWIVSLSENAQQLVREAMLYAARQIKKTVTEAPRPSQFEPTDDFFDLGTESNSLENNSVILETSVAEMEVLRYISDPCTENLSVLNGYPLVKELFLRYNTPLPSSAPVERLFSHATMINLPMYNRLSDDNFEKRVLALGNAKQTYN